MRWLRILNVMVILALVCAAAFVYKLKFESTLQAEQVASLRAELRRERDAIAGLRAEWAKLDNPDRIQTLAKRHLTMRPIEVTQFDDFKGLPPRPIELAPPGTADPIASMIESTVDAEIMSGTTGSLSGKP